MEMNSANMKADEELRKKLGMVKLDGSNDIPIGQDALILTPRAPVNITSANEVSLTARPIPVLALFLRARCQQLLFTLPRKKYVIS